MIRRGFWLTAGVVTGVYGYRRVSALGRRLSASLNPASSPGSSLNPASSPGSSPNPGSSPGSSLKAGHPAQARLAKGARRGAIRAARETYRFTRDVREGMELYTARHSAAAGSTLSTDREIRTEARPEVRTYEPEDGR
ncbi:MAG TPA: hypothetical protein VMA97_11315 [Streptosporangiaceae bacterium]|nr:hypothetical protein [Streptosporangiaceae bacterium]